MKEGRFPGRIFDRVSGHLAPLYIENGTYCYLFDREA